MTLFQILAYGFGGLASLGVLAGGLGVFRMHFNRAAAAERTAAIESAKTLAEFWRVQAAEYKEVMAQKETSWNTKFEKLTRDIGILQGQLEAERTQNARLEAIFKDRNPETEQFMKSVTEAMGEIRTFMHSINEHMKQDFKIESTVQKV